MSERGFADARASTNEQELQASSETFLIELAQLEGLELRKRHLAPRDKERLPLAHEIEDRTVGLLGLSRYQTRLIELASAAASVPDPTPRRPGVVLEEWREAERAVRDARSAMDRASDSADQLRDEHSRSVRHYSVD